MASTQVVSHVKTGDIQVGDTVLTHGMRVRIDETRTFGCEGHGHLSSTSPCCIVHAHIGTVLNLDEVHEAGVVPMSFLRTEKWEDGKGWVTDRTDRWVVQGNHLATWTVEREEA